MSLAATIKAMASSGCSPEQIAAVAEAHEAEIEAAAAKKRAKAAARKARWRTNSAPDCPRLSTGQNVPVRDERGHTPSPKERSPTPPKEITPTPSSLRSDSLNASARDVFIREFWPEYPHKVGKPAAEKAFVRLFVEMRGAVAPVLRGVERYIREKPLDRAWLNPTTFLNQRRFEDAPATPPARAGPNGHHRPTMAEMSRMDEPGFSFDDLRSDPRHRATESPDRPDQGAGGFAGRLSVEDHSRSGRGKLVDL